jgi:hypothetical protein
MQVILCFSRDGGFDNMTYTRHLTGFIAVNVLSGQNAKSMLMHFYNLK